MQPTLCSRCHKNVAVIFVTRIEGGETKNEGLCLKCAKELGIKPVEDMMQKMGISEEDLDGLPNEMMSALGGGEGPAGPGPGGGGRVPARTGGPGVRPGGGRRAHQGGSEPGMKFWWPVQA